MSKRLLIGIYVILYQRVYKTTYLFAFSLVYCGYCTTGLPASDSCMLDLLVG